MWAISKWINKWPVLVFDAWSDVNNAHNNESLRGGKNESRSLFRLSAISGMRFFVPCNAGSSTYTVEASREQEKQRRKASCAEMNALRVSNSAPDRRLGRVCEHGDASVPAGPTAFQSWRPFALGSNERALPNAAKMHDQNWSPRRTLAYVLIKRTTKM